ncbi:MAG: hypothetical protein QM710_07385 [Flavobacterium sp.]
MKLFNILYAIILLFSFSGASAQEEVPTLTGKVSLSIKEGTFTCDMTLSNIPELKDYFIRLNSGMNILHFRSLKPNNFLIGYDRSLKDSTSTGESSAYYFPGNKGKGKFLPKELRIRYTGKFPVATDTIENVSRDDWKGNIAFNGYSVRTDAAQTAWYPMLYDIEKDKLYNEVKYDIELQCSDCTTLYVNGNLPVEGTKASFKSEIPKELSLYCGDFDFKSSGGTYILNPDLTDEQFTQFCGLTNSYQKYYEDKIGIPFGGAVTFVNTTPTSARNAWLYVTYPTIFNIGYGENGLVSLFNPKIQNWYRPFIAHELGHYYFGTYKVFNSALGDMMSEGFTEYLSLQVTRDILGAETYQKKISDKLKELEGFKPVPFAKVKSKADYKDRELYVYYYAPLMFTAIEKEIGREKMWQWLGVLLKTKTDFTNYKFLTQSLEATLQDKTQFESIKSKYFDSDKSLKNIESALKKA